MMELDFIFATHLYQNRGRLFMKISEPTTSHLLLSSILSSLPYLPQVGANEAPPAIFSLFEAGFLP